jgi:hypothetical protein
MWIRLKTNKQIPDRSGKPRSYHRGDWIEIGKHLALLWIAQGDAEDYAMQLTQLDEGSGIVSQLPLNRWMEQVKEHIRYGPPMIAFPRTLILSTTGVPRTVLVHIGLRLLERWEVAVPVASYDTLACHLGDDTDRVRTQQVIRDLRVPYYDTRMVFVRDCQAGQELVARWIAEREGACDQLAFLRAMYQAKPIVCALPVTWSAGL